ncbi:hypothetical protein [Amycolatopsis alkalitolerans]|uniref:Uncharacterized protein n=1 Tax=Amycolatopsis alkalitolerans TaxID=2547244 RepID=A0A5C4LTC3_9PSEU|nr:hypothetical protein [Amycolatopsis alkalitolerans]TNC20580.1 hypothetical protein FG385_30640 [Amycolatopsis alkalitolerans]
MVSPLSRHAVLDALVSGVEDGYLPPHASGAMREVRGTWDGPDLRLRVRRIGSRNSFSHQIRIQVLGRSDETAEVRGYIGVALWVRVFLPFWLAGVATLTALAAVALPTISPPPPLAIVLIPVFMFAAGLGIAIAGTQAGRKDGEFLLEWVRLRLDSQLT